MPLPVPDFQKLFESAPGLYLTLLPNDPLFTIVAVNNNYLAATMTERERILGKGLFEVFPDNPADPAATGVTNLHASLRQVLLHRKPDVMAVQKYDVRQPASRGGRFEERYWSPVNTPVFHPSGGLAYIIHRVEDVTEFVLLKEHRIKQDQITRDLRIRHEQMEGEVFLRAQQLQQLNRQLRAANEQLALLRDRDSAAAQKALAESELRYRTLIAATTSIVWTRDAGGAFVDPQPSWSAYTGQTPDEYMGFGWLDAIHPEDRERVRQCWRQAAAPPAPRFEMETRIWSAASNRFCYFMGRGAPVQDLNSQVKEWMGTETDIDDRKRIEEQLRHTAKLESLGVLAGGIAHDFNNLLTGILGNASQALEIFQPRNAADKAVLENIVGASERAAHLTRQMLAYSGRGNFLIRDVDLSDLVRGISVLVQSSIPKTVHLRLELRDRLPCIQVDPGQMQQVVMNLIINGAEAIPETADGVVTVTTQTQTVDEEYARNFDMAYSLQPGLYVALEVHDNGSGMTAETQRKIFDPFFTTKFHGRGLGLSAVQGIVRGHKGALRVYSEPGHGTTFKILFPASGATAPETVAEQKQAHRSHRTGTVLVIDDEELVRKTITAVLERGGYSVVTAHDGQAGVDVFREMPDRVELVILDLTMPTMNGEETMRHLRALRPHIPVILSSGYNQVEATRKFVGKGLASFLQKPFTVSQLMNAVEGALDGQKK